MRVSDELRLARYGQGTLVAASACGSLAEQLGPGFGARIAKPGSVGADDRRRRFGGRGSVAARSSARCSVP